MPYRLCSLPFWQFTIIEIVYTLVSEETQILSKKQNVKLDTFLASLSQISRLASLLWEKNSRTSHIPRFMVGIKTCLKLSVSNFGRNHVQIHFYHDL